MRKCAILAALAAALAAGAPASADPGGRALAAEQLWLARVCVHELTWNVENDCEPMHQVLLARGRDRGVVRGIQVYSSRFWAGTSTRPWARALAPAHFVRASPEGWPEAWPRFAAFRERWMAAHEHAGRIVRGEIPTRCVERPDHWGSLNPALPDLARAERMIARGLWRRVDCGPTLQGYYARTR